MDPDGVTWITERRGTISKVDTSTGTVKQVATMASVESGESGMMGIALHPDFTSTSWVFVAYSYAVANGIRNRISRPVWDGADPGSEKILLTKILSGTNQDGARLPSRSDQFLYTTTGDAANTNLPKNRSSLAGKVLRLQGLSDFFE